MTLTDQDLRRRFRERGAPMDHSATYATAQLYCLEAATAIVQTASGSDDQAVLAVDGLQEVLYRWERAVLLTTGGRTGAYPDEVAQVREMFNIGEPLDVASAWPYTLARKWCTQIATTIVQTAANNSDRAAALDLLVTVLYRWDRAIAQAVQRVTGGGLAAPFPPPPVRTVAAPGHDGGGPSPHREAPGVEACRGGEQEIERMRAALMSVQEYMWDDLDRAYRESRATPPQKSIGCEALIARIQEIAAIIGPMPAGPVPYSLLAAGVYVDVYAAIGVTVLVPDDVMDRARTYDAADPRPVNS